MKWLSIVSGIINTLLGLLSPEVAKKALDSALDVIEDAVEDSSNKIDDVIVLPLCRKAREILNIPDEDIYSDSEEVE